MLIELKGLTYTVNGDLLNKLQPQFSISRGRTFKLHSNQGCTRSFNYTQIAKAIYSARLRDEDEPLTKENYLEYKYIVSSMVTLYKKGYETGGALSKISSCLRWIVNVKSEHGRNVKHKSIKNLGNELEKYAHLESLINAPPINIVGVNTQSKPVIQTSWQLPAFPEEVWKNHLLPRLSLDSFLKLSSTNKEFNKPEILGYYIDHVSIESLLDGIGLPRRYIVDSEGKPQLEGLGNLQAEGVVLKMYEGLQSFLSESGGNSTLNLRRIQSFLLVMSINQKINQLLSTEELGDQLISEEDMDKKITEISRLSGKPFDLLIIALFVIGYWGQLSTEAKSIDPKYETILDLCKEVHQAFERGIELKRGLDLNPKYIESFAFTLKNTIQLLELIMNDAKNDLKDLHGPIKINFK